MRDMLRWGSAWLSDQESSSLTETVTYSREGGFSVTLPAVVGRGEIDVNTPDLGVVVARSQDFIFQRSDFVVDGSPIQPERNDKITRTLHGVEVIEYEVLPQSASSENRMSDEHDYRVRISTKRISP